MPRQDEFGIALYGNKSVGIAKTLRFLFIGLVLFFAANISPHFICLHVFDREAIDTIIKKRFAALSGEYHCAENGIAVDAR
jgi:hypothetical protein